MNVSASLSNTGINISLQRFELSYHFSHSGKMFKEKLYHDVFIKSCLEKVSAYGIFYVFLQSDEQKFDLVAINPGYMLGPVLHGSWCTSMEVCI